MLNKENCRELAYVVIIDDIKPITGSDNCECAVVGGWQIMVHKNEFYIGCPAIYFEIDSLLPKDNPVFSFMEKKHYKVKTQKYTFGGKGNFISQGLLMSANNFGWKIIEIPNINKDPISWEKGIQELNGTTHLVNNESRFLTAALGVTYAEAGDNRRKAAPADKYKLMARRNGKLFSHQPFKFLMKHTWGKKLLFLFFGRKRDKRSSWPAWVQKTDEERIQNMPWILDSDEPWIATEKIDGTSTTFTIKRKKLGKYDFFVCSRNVCFDKPDKKCFYETNVYTEMALEYLIEPQMVKMLFKDDRFADCEWITIQGETYGQGIQNRDYSITGHDFLAFNFITSKDGRYGTPQMRVILEEDYAIPCVPIVDVLEKLPSTVEEVLDYATGISVLDGKPREGIVFRTVDGKKSFKAVSNEYLLKYHS